MSVEAALYAELTGNAGVAALVADRVYPDVAPSSADLPRLTYQRISTGRHPHLAGASGLVSPRFQVICWASSRASAGVVADAVREALDGFSGTLGSGGNTVNARGVFLDGQGADYAPPTEGGEIGVYSERLEFIIWHRETVPAH